MDRIDKKVILTQPKNVDRIITAFGVDKGAPTPALANVMGDDDTSPLLQNQKQFMSLNSLLSNCLQSIIKQQNWIYARQPEWHNMFMVVRKLIN